MPSEFHALAGIASIILLSQFYNGLHLNVIRDVMNSIMSSSLSSISIHIESGGSFLFGIDDVLVGVRAAAHVPDVHFRLDPARADGIDPHAATAPFTGQGPRQAEEPVL